MVCRNKCVDRWGLEYMSATTSMLASVARKRSGGTPPPVGAWTDNMDPSTTDTSNPFVSNATTQNITAGQSGDCTKVRIYFDVFFGSTSIKAALYDSSGNLLSSSGIETVLGTGYMEIPITSQAVTSGTGYRVGWCLSAGGLGGKYLASQPSGTSRIDFGLSYAAFPSDPDAGSSLTFQFPVGMFITP